MFKEQTEMLFKVCVRCATFNHLDYIECALNGFVMQQTEFPVLYMIIDDASTDGTSDVIKDFLALHFDIEDNENVISEDSSDYTMQLAQHKENKNCFFAYYRLKYNHWSIPGKRQRRYDYVNKWDKNAQFIALCEGDDYWVDPDKLKKQVAILDGNRNCAMVCCRTKLLSVKDGVVKGENACYEYSRYVDTKDIILKGGLFISTCSVLYRKSVVENYPDYCIKCHIGDYPLYLTCAMKGTVYYLNEVTSVYRVDNPASWVGIKGTELMTESKIKGIKSEVEMLKGFAVDYPEYKTAFYRRIYRYLMTFVPYRGSDLEGNRSYLIAFKSDINKLRFYEQIPLLIRLSPFYRLYNIYFRLTA